MRPHRCTGMGATPIGRMQFFDSRHLKKEVCGLKAAELMYEFTEGKSSVDPCMKSLRCHLCLTHGPGIIKLSLGEATVLSW